MVFDGITPIGQCPHPATVGPRELHPPPAGTLSGHPIAVYRPVAPRAVLGRAETPLVSHEIGPIDGVVSEDATAPGPDRLGPGRPGAA